MTVANRSPHATQKPQASAREQKGFTTAFARFAAHAAWVTGSAWAFLAAVAVVVVWGLTGSWFGYSDTWQLIANTVTNLITFIVVFLIQNSQNRESKAINLKLDEIILSLREARNEMIDIEGLSEKELEQLAKRYEFIRREYERRRKPDESAA